MSKNRVSHLDAVQEKNEERNEPYLRYGEVSTGIFTAAMRQEQLNVAWLCQVAGSCGA